MNIEFPIIVKVVDVGAIYLANNEAMRQRDREPRHWCEISFCEWVNWRRKC